MLRIKIQQSLYLAVTKICSAQYERLNIINGTLRYGLSENPSATISLLIKELKRSILTTTNISRIFRFMLLCIVVEFHASVRLSFGKCLC